MDTTAPDETASTMKKLLDRMDRWETKLPATRKEKQEFMVLKSMPTVTSQQVNYNSKFWGRVLLAGIVAKRVMSCVTTEVCPTGTS